MGIEQLVDMYKGNPGPLEAKVEKDQQGQKPGELPEDLEEAIALQKIAELQNGAKNQQAMQAGGAQPSIVEKLKQMLAAQQRQQAQPPQMPQGMPQGMPPQQGMPQMAQGQPPMPQGPQGQPPMPQGQPVMAARGGSIDQLMSNLGRHYAGGGIIAFNGEDESKVEDKKAKQREEDRRALLEPLAAIGDIAQLPIAAGYNLAVGAGSGLERFLNRIGSALTGKEVNTQTDDQVGNKFRFSPTPFTDMLRKPTEREVAEKQAQATAQTPDAASIRGQLNAADAARFAEKPAPKPPAATAASGAPRPTAGGPSAGGPGGSAAPAAALDPNSLRGLIEANIRKNLGRDEDTEWTKGAKRYEDFMGIDKLLQPREARIAEREAMLKKIQGERTPAWVEALSAAGRPVRGGLGTLLSQMGGAAESTRKGYSAEDLRFFDEIGAMRDEVAKLKLDGKFKAAAAGEAAIKAAIDSKEKSEQSGASLVATDERTETSKQIARDAAAGRAQIAAAQLEARKADNQQRQRNWVAEQERKWQDTLNKNPEYKKLIDQRSMQERFLYMPNIDPKTQEKAQATIDAINEKIAKMLPTAGGGAANIPPPPKGAVTRVG